MSEYQYYEFRAIDRPLTQREQDELRQLSSRAEITATSFVNEYNYGDFRGDVNKIMEKYFDAFVYLANWGTRQFILRLPATLFDLKSAQPYLREEGLEVRKKGEFVFVEFRVDEEPVGWEEGDGWLDELLPIRDQLLRGDVRSLYVGWLAAVRFYDEGEDPLEPTLPPGMQKLDQPLKKLAEFLFLDDDLLNAVSRAGTGRAAAGPSPQELRNWIAALPEREKVDVLCRLVEEQQGRLSIELLRRFQKQQTEQGGKENLSEQPSSTSGRTFSQLLKSQEDYAKERMDREAREKAAARKKHLAALAKRETEAWREIDAHLATKMAKKHDLAVALLCDLVDLGQETQRQEEIAKRIRRLREKHRTRIGLMRRFNRVGLPG